MVQKWYVLTIEPGGGHLMLSKDGHLFYRSIARARSSGLPYPIKNWTGSIVDAYVFDDANLPRLSVQDIIALTGLSSNGSGIHMQVIEAEKLERLLIQEAMAS